MRKLRVINSVNVNDFTSAQRFIIHDAETVARLNGKEIHRPGIDILQMKNQHLRRSGTTHIIPER